MMKSFIVICNSSLENICKTVESNDITTTSIIESLNLVDCILFIVTPSYQLLLQPSQSPIKEYPELIQNEPLRPHKKPKYYLLVKDSSTKFEEITIFIYLRFNYSIPPVTFPVSFNFGEIESSNLLFSYFQYQLNFEYKSVEFFLNDNQPLDECPMSELVELLRYNYLTCKVQLYNNSMTLKQLEDRMSLVKSFFENECQFITSISQLAFFWQPLMIKEQLLEKDDANYIFSSFNSTVTAHNMFLLEFQQKMNENQNIVDLFCDFQYFFQQTENLFRNYSVFECFFKNKIKYFDFQTKLDNTLKATNCKNREPFFDLFFLPVSRLNEFNEFLLKITPLTPSYHVDSSYLEEAKTVCKNCLAKLKTFLAVNSNAFNEIVNLEDRIVNRNQFDILSPSRNLLSAFKGKVDHGISNQGYIYIFNDIILLTKIARKGETGKYMEYCYNFRYLTGVNTLYIYKNEREFIQFTFLDENNFNFAVQQIRDQKMLYYSKLNILDNLLLWECVESTYTFQLNSCSNGVFVGDFMYLIGGCNGQKYANHVSVYDIKKNQLKTIYNPLPGRKYHSITELNGVIYISGGIGTDSHSVLGDFITLDTNSADTSLQQRLPQNLPCPRYGHTLVSANKQLFMFGGIDRNKNFLGDFYMCTCFSNSCLNFKQIESPDTPCARSFHSSVMMKERYVIIHGGIYEKKVLDDVAIFDTESKKWITPILNGDSIVPRYMHKAIMYGNWMIVIGGCSNDTNKSLHPFGIMFKIDEEEKIVGTIVNFTYGGNDRPNLSNFSIGIYNHEIIIIGGYDKIPENTSHGIFKLSFPKTVLNSVQLFAKRIRNRHTIPAKHPTTKVIEPNYIANTLLTNTKDEGKTEEIKNPFLTNSYYLELQKKEKTENKEILDTNENNSNNLKNFDSLSSIKVDLPNNFSQITPKQAPSSYSKPFAMFDSLLPIVNCSKKKEGLYTFPFKGDPETISTTKNIPEKKKEKEEPVVQQFQSNVGMLKLPPKLDSDDDNDYDDIKFKSPAKAVKIEEETNNKLQQSSLMAMMPPKLDSLLNDNDDDTDT